jgi:hypothetical protein
VRTLNEFPYTNSWPTQGDFPYCISTFSTATYSPCDSLRMFFLRSMTESVPFGLKRPTSPVCSQPSTSVAAVFTSSL